MGNWIKMEYESSKSHNIYAIDCHWVDDHWEAVACTCKGFTNRATCRHLEEAQKELADIPPPVKVLDGVPPKLRFWFECVICNGTDFMLKPKDAVLWDKKLSDILIVVCSKCGRQYEI